jgi:hypothetical protein
VAIAALGRLDGGQSARSFLHTIGVDTGRGVFTTWRDKKMSARCPPWPTTPPGWSTSTG